MRTQILKKRTGLILYKLKIGSFPFISVTKPEHSAISLEEIKHTPPPFLFFTDPDKKYRVYLCICLSYCRIFGEFYVQRVVESTCLEGYPN